MHPEPISPRSDLTLVCIIIDQLFYYLNGNRPVPVEGDDVCHVRCQPVPYRHFTAAGLIQNGHAGSVAE